MNLKRLGFTSGQFSAAIAALIVSYGSSAAIFYQAAVAVNASHAQIISWFTAFAIGCGILTLYLTLRFKLPIMIAWCSPGAAIIASTSMISYTDAIGAFIFASILILIFSVLGWFDFLVKHIPKEIAAAMLVGVILNFTGKVFTSMEAQPLLVLVMLVAYFLSKLRFPRYSLLIVLVMGFLSSAMMGMIDFNSLVWEWPALEWVNPTWSLSSITSIGIPLFIVTILTQNVPGISIFKIYGYDAPTKPIVNTGAIGSAVMAPLGAL